MSFPSREYAPSASYPATSSSGGSPLRQAATAALQPLIAAQEYRVLAQAYLTLGEAYHEQGHLELLQGNNAAGRTAFENASANYALCIRQKDAAITDQTLAEKIVASYCVPYKESADASLAGLK